MKKILISAAMLLLPSQAVAAKDDVFDVHVHLWHGEKSLQSYEAQLKASNVKVTGFAAMWFGGPNHAAQGKPAETRANNDKLVALAAKHSGMLPVATVHPYDGPDALL